MRYRNYLGLFGPLLSGTRRLGEMTGLAPAGFLRVLSYHDIPPSESAPFKSQMKFLSDRYRFVDPAEFGALMSGETPIEGGNLLLTFDDGFHSHRVVSEEILAPLGIRAMFFIPSDFPSCRDPRGQHDFIRRRIFDGAAGEIRFSESLRPMYWDDLEFLLKFGHAIGSHTRTHRRLSGVQEESELADEIIGSSDDLSNRLGTRIEHFAYPFGNVGSISASAVSTVRRRYRFGFSGVRGDNGPKINPMVIRRETVVPTYSLGYLRFIVEGGLSPYYRNARRRLDGMADGEE